jgi:chromosome segregation protein
MHLKEIVISGFKSFADRTRLDLRRGVTAVVGPNGCGKSNIVDAIRWVLGEQSAKALRGASMQDVIFEGTDQRKRLPTCEVSLTFSDCEAELGTAFNEVEIARRVTRDGGSDYFINGKVSRLKDIQRLFANTGVGRVSYSFMLQGQIDQILSTNPGERRTIFEEAAGITLYKAQRKEALSKLSLVDANLARVTDVIEEVSRQIGSLKRQASKALRYQRIKHRLTHLDLAFSAYRYAALKDSIDALAGRAGGLRGKLAAHADSMAADEAALAVKKEARAALSEKLQAAQQQVFDLRSKKENADNQAGLAAIRSQDLQARRSEYRDEVKGLRAQQNDLAARARSEAENKQLQLDVVDDSDRVFRDRNAELIACQGQLGELEAQLQQRRKALLAAENRIHRARSRCTSLEVDLKTDEVKHAGLKESLLALTEAVVRLEQGHVEVQRKLAQRREAQQRSEGALERARVDSSEIRQHCRSIQEQLQQEDRGIARQTAQLNVLEDLQANFEGLGEGAKAILGKPLAAVVDQDRVAILSKELKVQAAYTGALEALLGQASEALFIGQTKTALELIASLDAQQLGRACLQVKLEAGHSKLPGVELPAAIVPAASVVLARDSSLSEAVARLLANCYFTDKLEDFVRFWNAHPQFNFLLVATANGEVIDGRGLIYGGRSSGKKAPGIIEREAEIRRLRSEIAQGRKGLNRLREQSTGLEEQRRRAEAAVEQQRQVLSELASEVSALVAEERSQRQQVEQNVRAQRKSEDALERLAARQQDSAQALEQATQALQDAEQSLDAERQSGADLEAAIASARDNRDQKREALADVRLELTEKKQRLASVDRVLSEVQRETAALQQRILRRNQELEGIEQQIGELQARGARERERSFELEAMLQGAIGQLEQDRAALQEMDADIARMDGSLSGRRKQGRSYEHELTKLEIRLAEERSQIGFIQTAAEDDYQIDLQHVDWKAELWDGNVEFEKRVNLDDLDDSDQLAAQPSHERRDPTDAELAEMGATNWATVEQEVAELKRRISNMGPVNLDAISEYADLKERHDFLKNQSDDLWKAKNVLVKSIDEINETSQNLFRQTFEQVRENFAYTYGKISGGGSADLLLVDSDDPLESGIEIIARPPGTRLKSVTLLSGGQRTMAAVALLFAIYLVKPSPFCVLDEIDAALDDANIGRFCETLHGFTDKSQFLIVTHNKRTISNADTVFGVTMPEKGVSKLLSMRFNRDTKQPELAGAGQS